MNELQVAIHPQPSMRPRFYVVSDQHPLGVDQRTGITLEQAHEFAAPYLGDKSVGECYLDHFERFFGKAVAREWFALDEISPPIQVLSFDHVFPECRVFCSFGFSRYALTVHSLCEVFVAVDDGWEDVPLLLARALFGAIENRMSVVPGMAIYGLESFAPEFTREYGKSALYVASLSALETLPQDVATVSLGDRVGSVYVATFISSQEVAFWQRYGAPAMERLLEKQRVDPMWLRRPSAA